MTPKPKSPLPWSFEPRLHGDYWVCDANGAPLAGRDSAGADVAPDADDAAYAVHAANTLAEMQGWVRAPARRACAVEVFVTVSAIIDAINRANLSIGDIDRIEEALKGQLP
jgi:hypothetical protein